MRDGAVPRRETDGTDGRRSRDVLGDFPTSVVALTTTDAGERPHGVTVGTFHALRVA
ncbi:hypothetical protein [Streptomyces sp. NPDC086519]|uniref:hypothetical protein n=1 Tax=Streptomyces sp. NPDC086519 TaxID=3154863 RepID=UPI00341B31D7